MYVSVRIEYAIDAFIRTPQNVPERMEYEKAAA